MSYIKNIFDIIGSYEVILFDIWGVIMEDVTYPKIPSAINKIIELKDTYILTNMPHSRELVGGKLLNAGINISNNKIFSSGYASQYYIKDLFNSGCKVFCFDDTTYQDLFKPLGIDRSELVEDSDLIILSQHADSLSEVNLYKKTLESAAKYNIPALCINPDTTVPYKNSIRYCGGFFAKEYQNMGGNVNFVGKPYPYIYKALFKNIKNINKEKILMVGDTLDMDILGAKNVGIDSAVVTTGNIKKIIGNNNDDEVVYKKIMDHSNKFNIIPDFVVRIA